MPVNHRVVSKVAVILFLGSSVALANSPELLWESEAVFKQPESAVYDATREVLYVSNVNGGGMDKDGNGFISKLSADGSVVELEWITGLDGPKGLTIVGDKLYASDITALVEMDIESGEITERYEAEGAMFMNDVVADSTGNVYVSDMAANNIHKLSDGTMEPWISDAALENPNGLLVEDDALIVGSWGVMNDDFSTDVPGNLKSISLADGTITVLGDGSALGNLDGVEPDGQGNYYVTDWVAGKLLHITAAGTAETLLTLEQGSADLTVLSDAGLIVIPMMLNDKVVAYQIAP